VLTDEELRQIQESARRINEELANIRAVIEQAEAREDLEKAKAARAKQASLEE
jgi:hypothetical protein